MIVGMYKLLCLGKMVLYLGKNYFQLSDIAQYET